MSDHIENNESLKTPAPEEDEIDLLELARVIWGGRKLIIRIVVIFTFLTLVASFLMTNIYTAKAVLKPVSQGSGSSRYSSLMSQFGGLANLAGIATPGAASSTEMINLLKSNILKKTVIERYDLLPVLFPDSWDEEKKDWKKPGISLNPLVYVGKLIAMVRPADPSAPKREPGVPDIRNGIRRLSGIINVNYDMKEDIITISADFDNPEMAAKIVDYFIITLNDHMSGEAKRIANINKDYLEKHLQETSDVLVQQKIYNLIAEKIETIMMADVKEGFAFKVLDPPMVPDMKSKPKRGMMVVAAFMVSLFLGVFVVLAREYVKKLKAKSAGGPNEA